jgi:serine/threonine protein kinase, bacterial
MGMTVEPTEFGALLRRHRIDAGLTQEELAERAQLSARVISDLERGVNRIPRVYTLRQLADALQLPASDRVAFITIARERTGTPAPPPPSTGSDGERALPLGGFLGALPSDPIVAREDEIDRIMAMVDLVETGTGQLIVVSGEPGIGKTRVAQEIMVKLRNQGFLIAAGRCYQATANASYAPMLEIMSVLYRAAPEAIRRAVPTRWPRLAGVLPNYSFEHFTLIREEPEGHSQLFPTVADFFAALAEERPVAVLLDDLQWADDASLELVKYVARHTRANRVFILAAYRDDNLPRDHPLTAALRELIREHLVERVSVRRLTSEGTGEMVVAALGSTEADEDFVQFVQRRTKGNPFFIHRLLQSLGDRYRLIRQVGVGGMGRVFEAVDTHTEQRVAVKLMFARTEADTHAIQRFGQEGAVLARLKHPNIVETYGTFQDEHAVCIVMELLGGESLDHILEGEVQDLHRTKHLIEQVAEALRYAHDQGIVHRDIKPHNVMILPHDHVKVADFGIARLLRPFDPAVSMTFTGMTMGTPLYMAPEQIRGQRVDGRADVYSLGTVMYQMVTGQPPFAGDDPMMIGIRHVQEAPVPPSRINPRVPGDWEAVILRALAKEPAERYPSAAAMHIAVAALSTDWLSEREEMVPQVPRFNQRLLLRDMGPRLLPSATVATWRWLVACAALVLVVAAVFVYMTKPLGLSGSSGPSAVRFGELEGLTVDGRDNVYAVDIARSRVDKLSPSGALLSQLAIIQPERFRADDYSTVGPDGAVLDGHGDLYVADYGYHGIQKLTPDGRLIAPWPYQINRGQAVAFGPTGLARDAGGNLYAADTLNNRIVKFSASGTVITMWTALGMQAGGLQGPTGVAVDSSGSVYVADTSNNRIVKLSSRGQPRKFWGSTGSGPGQFESPAGMTFDPSGNLLVADTDNHRIQVLSRSGRPLAQWGNAQLKFNQPIDVKEDSKGHVYVADSANNVIYKLSRNGRLLAVWGKPLQ